MSKCHKLSLLLSVVQTLYSSCSRSSQASMLAVLIASENFVVLVSCKDKSQPSFLDVPIGIDIGTSTYSVGLTKPAVEHGATKSNRILMIDDQDNTTRIFYIQSAILEFYIPAIELYHIIQSTKSLKADHNVNGVNN
jgi:hypothetical protein